MDYGRTGNRIRPSKEPRDKTRPEHPRGKLGGREDKSALLERLKAAARDSAGPPKTP
ncbi:MAG: hypothetical protein Kow0013_29060 [Pararhodobacter sp.]